MHPASGHYARLTPLCPMHALEREGTYYSGNSLAAQLHLTQCDNSYPPPAEYDPSCERLLDQVRQAHSPR